MYFLVNRTILKFYIREFDSFGHPLREILTVTKLDISAINLIISVLLINELQADFRRNAEMVKSNFLWNICNYCDVTICVTSRHK